MAAGGGEVGMKRKTYAIRKGNMTFPWCENGHSLEMGVTKELLLPAALLQRKRLVGQSDPLKATGKYSKTHLWGK